MSAPEPLTLAGAEIPRVEPQAAPWRLDLSDARYTWPTSFAFAWAARCVACWRLGALPLYACTDPPEFGVTARQWERMGLVDVAVVMAATLHGDRALLRLPEAIVRARHAQDVDLLDAVGDCEPETAATADLVGLGLIEEHRDDILALGRLLEARGALFAEALAVFAVERGLMHRPRPLLLALASP
ncbi:hypothetical protein [Cupriavidus sp. AcVe19-6a]|uniref:hypothetical protein n=1 Tax=Cupriavidus sp. AcVe19-6a TaxID=2821358 RepID=UPI001AE288E0|nr:hypothetical protein [Cupriavidus sp. AcVe19-6a]MBP0634250.1 hypothetical protein [Cupriavidus sp. AcVe19-6a]